MSEPEKTTAAKDESSPDPQIEMTPEPLAANAQVERYLKRKAEVTEKDHREFQVYLEEKARQIAPVAPPPPRKKFTLSRRNALKVVAGTAVAGEAAALGYSLTGGSGEQERGHRHRLWRAEAGHRPRDDGFSRRYRRPQPRTLGRFAADKDGRRHLCHRPAFEPGARLDLVLELRRLQPDLAPSLRLPQRRPLSLLRIHQQHPGRRELPDLWHSDEHHQAGARLQHLSGPL